MLLGSASLSICAQVWKGGGGEREQKTNVPFGNVAFKDLIWNLQCANGVSLAFQIPKVCLPLSLLIAAPAEAEARQFAHQPPLSIAFHNHMAERVDLDGHNDD